MPRHCVCKVAHTGQSASLGRGATPSWGDGGCGSRPADARRYNALQHSKFLGTNVSLPGLGIGLPLVDTSTSSPAAASCEARRMNVVIASILLLAAFGFAPPSQMTVEQVRQRATGAPTLRRPPRIVRIRPYRRPVVRRPRSLEPDEAGRLRRTEELIQRQQFPAGICKGC
jgi:hypothetical protein